MKKIMTNKQDEVTMVWYLDENKIAVVADVEKVHGSWQVRFRGRKMEGFHYKKEAVAHAKKWLREA